MQDLNEFDLSLNEDFDFENFDLNQLDEEIQPTEGDLYNSELARLLNEQRNEELNELENEDILSEQVPFSIPKDEENVEIMNDNKNPKNIEWEKTGSVLAQKRSIKNQY